MISCNLKPTSLFLPIFITALLLLSAAESTPSAIADDEITPAPVTCPVVEYAASVDTAQFKPPAYPAEAEDEDKIVCAVEIEAKSGHAIVLNIVQQWDSPSYVRVELYQLVVSDGAERVAVKEAV